MITSLQVGCGVPSGRYRAPEWVNVDLVHHDPNGARFVRASGAQLPFRDGAFSTIHLVHVLEHLPRNLHMPLLTEVRRVLAPGGSAFIEVPDFLATICELASAVELMPYAVEPARVRELIRLRTVGVYGKGRHHGDFHHWGFAPWYLEGLLRDAGLQAVPQEEMISLHHKQEPVMLYRCWHG